MHTGMNQNYAGYGGQQMIPQQQQQQQPGLMAQQQNMFQNQQQMMGAQNQQQMINAQNQQQMMGAQRSQEYMQQQRMQPGTARPPYLQVRPVYFHRIFREIADFRPATFGLLHCSRSLHFKTQFSYTFSLEN
jgi:hypothetical protein